jgi:hypothetical protein
MLQIDLWKRFLIWTTVAIGLALALPNGFYSRVEGANDARAALELMPEGSTDATLEAQAAQWPSFLPSFLVNLGLICAVVRIFWPRCRSAMSTNPVCRRCGQMCAICCATNAWTVGTIRLQDSAPDELRVRLNERPEQATRPQGLCAVWRALLPIWPVRRGQRHRGACGRRRYRDPPVRCRAAGDR